jgi:membrane glycosyltransferase
MLLKSLNIVCGLIIQKVDLQLSIVYGKSYDKRVKEALMPICYIYEDWGQIFVKKENLSLVSDLLAFNEGVFEGLQERYFDIVILSKEDDMEMWRANENSYAHLSKNIGNALLKCREESESSLA